MRKFIPVTYDFGYAPGIKKLLAEHGASAVAFYFMALGKMAMNGGWHWKIDLMALRCRGLKFMTIEKILHSSELFELTPEDAVLIADLEHNGIVDFKKSIFYTCRKEAQWVHKFYISGPGVSGREGARVGARVGDCADGGADGCADGRADGCVGAGPIDANAINREIEKEIETEKKKERWLASFFQSSCPHLLEMEEPMTVEQFDDLVKAYGIDEVKSVLCDMENETTLNKRSCARTAENWLKGRARRNKTKNETI